MLWYRVPLRLSAMLLGMGLTYIFVILLSQIMFLHLSPVLQTECYLFTVLLPRETTRLTSFFSLMPVTCDGKKKELLFMNTEERLISRQIVEG